MGGCISSTPIDWDESRRADIRNYDKYQKAGTYGHLKVSCLERRFGDDGPSGLVFYPCSPDLKPLPSSYLRQYLRQEIIDHGIVREGSLKGISSGCVGYKMEHEFPVTFEIPVHITNDGNRVMNTNKEDIDTNHHVNGKMNKHSPDSEDNNNTKKFPVMIFSHGLFGCREMYSHFARNIASHGVVVVAIEHEDGSACYAKSIEGVEIFYKPPPEGMEYSNRQDVRDFRGPMLAKRVKELSAVIAFFDKQDGANIALDSNNVCNNDELDGVLCGREDDSKIPGIVAQKMMPPAPPPCGTAWGGGADHDFDNGRDLLFADIVRVSKLDELHFAGHSFGGASMVQAVHDLHDALGSRLKTRICLDMWPWPLSDAVCEKACTVPSLFIESEEFMAGTEVALTKAIALKGNQQAKMEFAYLPGTCHQQFADTAFWLPPWLGRRVRTCGLAPREDVALQLNNMVSCYIACQEAFHSSEGGDSQKRSGTSSHGPGGSRNPNLTPSSEYMLPRDYDAVYVKLE